MSSTNSPSAKAAKNPFLTIAPDVLRHRHRIIPILPPDGKVAGSVLPNAKANMERSRGKVPAYPVKDGWKPYPGWSQAAGLDEHQLDALRSQYSANMGIVLGTHPKLADDFRLVGIDMDVTVAGLKDEIREAVAALCGGEDAFLRYGNPDKAGTIFVVVKLPAGVNELPKRTLDFGNGQKVELLANGQQSVIAGMHPSGHPFRWRNPAKTLPHSPVPEIPVITLEQLVQLTEHIREISTKYGLKTSGGMAGQGGDGHDCSSQSLGQDPKPATEGITTEEIRSLLAELPEEWADEYEHWLGVGMSLHHQYDGADDGLGLWDEFSQRSGKFQPGVCEERWRSFKRDTSAAARTLRSIIAAAKSAGSKTAKRLAEEFMAAKNRGSAQEDFSVSGSTENDDDSDRADRQREDRSKGGEQDEKAAVVAPYGSEDYLALEFATQHGAATRYVARWGKWLLWNGTRWEEDVTRHVLEFVRQLCRRNALAANKPNERKDLSKARTVSAVETLARSDRGIAATADQWDADPWLLNTPTGIVDLRTGKVRPGAPTDYCTKTTGTALGKSSDAKNWGKFLDEVTGRDKNLQGFLQRMAGYLLTGITREHALFFLYGTGANGKSVFVETLTGLLGGYATKAPVETLTVAKNERHPTDVAMLRGARMVLSSETEDGHQWAEAKIKSLTGDDRVTARFMRQDFFEFVPQFKLVVVGNHMPVLRNVDEAMKRRLHIVPFTVTIPEANRDKDLKSKLMNEWPAILAWAVEGCLAWQVGGLQPPASVTAATGSYLQEEDTLATWISDCLQPDATSWVSSKELFRSWSDWNAKRGESAGSPNSFSRKLSAKGVMKSNKVDSRGFKGYRIKASSNAPSPF